MSLERLRIRNKEGLEGQTRKREASPSPLWETLARPRGKAHSGVRRVGLGPFSSRAMSARLQAFVPAIVIREEQGSCFTGML